MTPSDDRPVSILLVDDQPADLLALEAVLEDLGQNLVKAHSGQEALRRLLEEDFAVVLLDVQMHGLDGFETAKRIRARERSRHTPIIFITAHDSDEFLPAKAYALGAVDYLVKPLVPVILRAKVAVFVELFRVARDGAEHKRAEEALKEADRRKDDFLALLGHELRNPLGPIRNAVQVLGLAGPADPLLKKAREMIERQVGHMARLIDDLLDVSRVAHGKLLLRKECVDLVALVRATAEDYRCMLEATGLKLAVQLPAEPLWVFGDPVRLSQAVGNLLHNANKFTDAGGRVGVQVTRDGGAALVTVRDTGVGMEPGMLARVFETFSQANRTAERGRGGLGLGLALVKGLVRLHGGEVHVASEGPGRGSEFTVRLPLEREPTALRKPAAPPAPGKARRILVIEDNQDAAESMRMLLGLAGHEVEVAYSGAAGVEAAQQFRPEVVLSDLGLPGGMDGYAVARVLRQEAALPSAYLVALTGYGQDEDQRRARDAGFDLHLTKPVDFAELQRVLASGLCRAGNGSGGSSS